MIESLKGWYRSLASVDLPDLGGLVLVMSTLSFRPCVGHLGTFRRSRQTGLWFVGKHSLYVRGN